MPAHRQIYQAIFRSIQDGVAVHPARLPSSRVLSQILGVSRNTILRAYDELAANGLIEGKRGSATAICRRETAVDPGVFSLRQIVRESGFPARILRLEDLDGNPLYVRF